MMEIFLWPSRTDIITRITPWLLKQRWFPGNQLDGEPRVVFYSSLGDDPRIRLLILELHDSTLIHIPLVIDKGSPSTPGFISLLDSDDVPIPAGERSTEQLHHPHDNAVNSLDNLEDPSILPMKETASRNSGTAKLRPQFDQPGASPSEISSEMSKSQILIDGTASPVFLHAWITDMEQRGQISSTDHYDAAAIADSLHRAANTALPLGGEQSNTTVIFHDSFPPVAAKFFRVLTTGDQPEVDVPMGLARVGWAHMPHPIAASYITIANEDGPMRCCTASVCEFIDHADDGFDYICRLASRKEPAIDELRVLGHTTASLHDHLMKAFGPGDFMSGILIAQRIMEQRDLAVAAYPLLSSEQAILEALDLLMTSMNELGQLPSTQRVHGDFHLGQCLHTSERWYILDFEGEPLRPAYERSLPDQPARDIAGLLRSIDYAAATSGASIQWCQKARQAFLDGYFSYSDASEASSAQMLVITALEVEKALYEVRYEALHRPDWIHIPLDALRRLLVEDVA
ncbi:MAG: phosphotransferase [Actinomycetaceae bacterium]|nr:phosphotransferase [Actinomycetaceae bacterium]